MRPLTRPISLNVELGEKAGRSPMPAASSPSGVKYDGALANKMASSVELKNFS
jgi:hypothetical protein